MSFRTRVVLNFVLVSIITASITVGVVASAWDHYFSDYTASNAENIMNFSADKLAESLANNEGLNKEEIENVIQPLRIFDSVSISVMDPSGDLVMGINIHDGKDEFTTDLHYTAATKMVLRSVDSDKGIYSIRLWANDPSLLMSGFDQIFRNKTYEALLGASLLAILLASILGIVFVRFLIGPINKISEAAREISTGDFTARSNIAGNDEIARLGHTFDDMAESLEKNQKLERQLTSDMAHELRTPLMSMQATLEAMIDGVFAADSEHLLLLNIEVKRLSKLVNALLKLSRLENRTEALHAEVTDLSSLVEEIGVVHESYISDAGLELVMKVQPNVMVVCDKDLIRQAVVNLLSNAVRYTPEGGTVTLRVRKDTEMAKIDIEDTGIGLTPEEAKLVFSRFWRADAARKQESGGLGVGLAVVKEIVQRHGGKVAAYGQPGKGATFTIMLPEYDPEASKRRARAALKAFEKRNGPTPRLRTS